MVADHRQLAALEQIARLKAERELQRFAAFSAHMIAARQKADALGLALEQCYSSVAPLGISEARMANAQAGRAARELRRADAELARLRPRFEEARKDAAREFGRAEVLLELARRAAARDEKPRL